MFIILGFYVQVKLSCFEDIPNTYKTLCQE
jgi:hypothetical protein